MQGTGEGRVLDGGLLDHVLMILHAFWFEVAKDRAKSGLVQSDP
jgi:hypothetical protein